MKIGFIAPLVVLHALGLGRFALARQDDSNSNFGKALRGSEGGVAGEVSAGGEVGRNYNYTEVETEEEEWEGSIYQVDNGPPADDHPFDTIVVEVVDGNDANPPPSYIPPPPNQGGGGPKPDFEKGPDGKIRVILQYKEGTKATVMEGLQDVELHCDWEEWNTVVISISEQALKDLQNNPNVEKLEPDAWVGMIDPPMEPDLQEEIELFENGQVTPYGVDMMEVSKLKVRGNGQKVCVLDTGYDRNHPDLPYDVDWIGVSDSGTPPTDTNGHGTHVAGTIAALDNDYGVVGVAPDASLVIGPYLKQTVTYISNYVEGIRMCKNKGARIVNMSFGTQNSECDGTNYFSGWMNDRLNEFYDNDGMLLVAAGGNHGDCTSNYDTLRYPASYDAVMSVAAVDSHARRADFSAKNEYVNIAASGVGVRSTVPGGGYKEKNGTSMASPHVAAMAAVVWSAMPWLSAQELRRHLESSAENIYLDYTGSGLVNHGFFPIVLRRSGKCLDHKGGTQDNYLTEAHLWECHGGHQQLWTYDMTRKLIVSSAGWCLSAFPYEGGLVHVYKCDTTDTIKQKWDYDVDAKTLKLEGYCLDADVPNSFNNGGNVSMMNCNGEKSQKWHLGNRYTEKALFCGHSDCYSGGDIYRASVGNWNHMPPQIGNDQLTRVIVPPGYAVELFEHNDYGGWNYIFASQDSHNYVSLNLGAVNDSVSSFKVRKLPDTGMVKLCRNTDCTGAGGVFYASVGQWSSMPYEIGNDELSFIHIPQGYFIEYFEHGNWGGWSRKYGACDRGINLRLVISNDAVSSFKIGLAC